MLTELVPTLRSVFRLTPGQAEALTRSVLALLGLKLQVPATLPCHAVGGPLPDGNRVPIVAAGLSGVV